MVGSIQGPATPRGARFHVQNMQNVGQLSAGVLTFVRLKELAS